MTNYEDVKITADSDEIIRIVVAVKASDITAITGVWIDVDDDGKTFPEIDVDESQLTYDGLNIVGLEDHAKLNELFKKAWMKGNYNKVDLNRELTGA